MVHKYGGGPLSAQTLLFFCWRELIQKQQLVHFIPIFWGIPITEGILCHRWWTQFIVNYGEQQETKFVCFFCMSKDVFVKIGRNQKQWALVIWLGTCIRDPINPPRVATIIERSNREISTILLYIFKAAINMKTILEPNVMMSFVVHVVSRQSKFF